MNNKPISEAEVERRLAYRPTLTEPLALVNTVLRSLPLVTQANRAPSRRSRWLVGTLLLVGLLITLVPDTYLLNLLAMAVGDLAGTTGNVGQGLGDWVSNPSLGGGSTAEEVIGGHPLVLLGLCICTIALLVMLYQTLATPLPRKTQAKVGR